MTRSRLSGFLLASIGSLAFVAPASSGTDPDSVSRKLRTARERYSEMRDLYAVYAAKTEVATEVLSLEQGRPEIEAYVRQLRIEIDSYPARRTGPQEVVYQEWLNARRRLTELDRQLELLRARMREIDEQALGLTARNTKRIIPGNRRDIQVVYPAVQRECLEAFRELKAAVEEYGKQEGLSREQVIRQAMPSLGPPGEVEDRYGPTQEFLVTFREYCGGRQSFGASPRAKATGGKRRPRRR
jgi:hypothetical protein